MTDDSNGPGRATISRRRFLASSTSVALGASLLGAATVQAAAATPRILRFSDHEPLGGMRTRYLKDVVFPAIERESSGRLKIEDHWDGAIAKAYDGLAAVSKGDVADMATVVPEYTAKELPLHQLFKSFPVGPTGGRQIDFFERVYAEAPAFPAELEGNNVVQLFFGTGYPVAFFSTAPLSGLDGLAGGKWRSASFWHLDFLRNAGAMPVTMHWGPEIYEALRTKSLDGLMVNVDSGFMLGVHEAAPHVLASKDMWLGHVYILAMNRDVWNGLDAEDRDAIRRAAAASHRGLGMVMEQSFDRQMADLRDAGASVRVIDRQEAMGWANTVQYRTIQSGWVEKQAASGVNAGAALATVTAIMGEMTG